MARPSFHWSSYTVQLLAVLLAALMLTGCSALQLDPSNTDLAPHQSEDAGAAQMVSALPTVKVEIRAAGRSAEFREVPLREGMCIGDALIETGLTRRFRRMNLELVRPTPQGILAKMDSRYEHKRARVNPLYDYALHPGDHLVVTEDTTTVLDDMLGGLTLTRGRSSR